MMQVTKYLKRAAGAAVLSLGLAYPACAAVCPKGIGGCTAPGRCFLYIDSDSNSLCDYTGRTSSPASSPGTYQPSGYTPSNPSAVQNTVSSPAGSGSSASTQATVVNPGSSGTTLPSSGSGSLLDLIHISVPLAAVLLFLVWTGIIFALMRKGFLQTPGQGRFPALALSALYGLPLSLISTFALSGGAVQGTVLALAYMAAAPPLLAYLWYKGAMTRGIILRTAGLSLVAGFVFTAPVMPMELGGLVGVLTGSSAVTAAVLILCAVIAGALVIGRAFCSSICPVGSVQELAYTVPVSKITISQTRRLELIRLGIFAAAAIAAVFMIDLIAVFGLYDFFSLTISAGFIIAAGLVFVSVFLYRPVCRILCPFGLLFAIAAEFSLFRLRRTDSCIGCRKCERVCPVSAAGAKNSKRECYLCGRCTETCPVHEGIRFSC